MSARLWPQREAEMEPVGYYCDHSDEPYGSRSHHDWQWVEGEGFVFQHQPDTITALAHVEQAYLKPEDRQKRCALAVPVYPGPIVAAELTAVRAERDEARAQSSAVAEFVAKRAEYITSINNCHNDADYWRWQGHAESRRQLAQQLGLPVAWPADYEQGATS